MTAAFPESGFPWSRPGPLAPPAGYARLREVAPVAPVELRSGQRVWLITSHELFRSLLRDLRVSSEHSHPGYPAFLPGTKRRTDDGRPPKLTYSGMDRPAHTVHRRMIGAEFAANRLARNRPAIQRIVDNHVDTMLKGGRPVDLVRALAKPVPSRVICELLGIPLTERAILQEQASALFGRRSSPDRMLTASRTLRATIDRVLADKETASGDDLLSRMIAGYRRSGGYDAEQMVELVGALVIAGHETTTNVIALGVAALLQHPDQKAELLAEPALFAPAAEELLRYLSIADLVTARVAVADIDIGGVTIHAGEGVVALGAAADHDPEVFDRPDALDIHRNTRKHVAFGYGIHKCFGQHLARLELNVVFTTLFARIPDLRLATDAAKIRIKEGAILHGIEELLVTW